MTFINHPLKIGSLTVVYAAGSMYEFAGNYGVSNVMAKILPSLVAPIKSKLDYHGITYSINVEGEYIAFQFTSIHSRLCLMAKEILECLSTSIANRIITEDVFSLAKNAALADLQTRDDNVLRVAFANAMRMYYNYYGRLGVEEDINNFKYSDMLNVLDSKFAVPNDIIIVGPEGINIPRAGVVSAEASGEPRRAWLSLKSNPECVELTREYRHHAVVCLTPLIAEEDLTKVVIGMNMLFSGNESPFYVNVANDLGVCYSDSGMVTTEKQGFCYFGVSSDENELSMILASFDSFVQNVGKTMNEEMYESTLNKMRISAEIENALRYKYVDRIIRKQPLDPDVDFTGITYGQVFDTVKKYINLSSILKYSI